MWGASVLCGRRLWLSITARHIARSDKNDDKRSVIYKPLPPAQGDERLTTVNYTGTAVQ
jgi:hypothetical protein